jgi:dihydroneopterin aldolase
LTEAQLREIVTPLAEAVKELRAENEATKAAAVEAANKAVEAQRNKGIETLLQEVDTPVDDAKFENMSKKQLVDVMCTAIESALASQQEHILAQVGQSSTPNDNRLAVVEKTLMSLLAKAASDETRSKHVDYDEYSADISKIMGENPAISFERAYFIAKSERVGQVPAPQLVNTEKPVNYATGVLAPGAVVPNQTTLQTIADRGNARRDDGYVQPPQPGTNAASGVVGFKSLLNAAIDAQVINKQQ